MIVVEPKILLFSVFPSPFSETVMKVHEIDPDWHVPLLWRSEFAHAVSKLMRRKVINEAEAAGAIGLSALFIGNREHLVSPYAVLPFVQNSKCSTYACEFIALADKLKAHFVTYDQQIHEQFPAIARTPEDFISRHS